MAGCYAVYRIIKRKRRHEQLIKKILKDYQNPFSLEKDVFIDRFCFDQSTAQYIRDLVAPVMKRHMGIPVALKVLVSLQILRTGCFQANVGDKEFFFMAQSTMSRAFDAFLDAILEVSSYLIEFPTISEFTLTEPKIYGLSKIQNIMGVVTCFPVYLTRPNTQIINAYSIKRDKYAINVQIVCDSDLRILDANVHWPGDRPNYDVWMNCDLRKNLNEALIPCRCFLVGDNSLPLEPWLLVPYEECQKTEELIFNDHINRALSVGKQCHNSLQTRFKCIHHKSRPLYYGPSKVSKIVVTCLILHNIGLNLNQDSMEPIDSDEGNFESSNYFDIDSYIEENLLKNEGMLIRDEIAKNLL